MGPPLRSHDESLSLAEFEQIESVCTGFENDWKAGKRPRLNVPLGDRPEPLRSSLLRELLCIDLEYRRRCGESPSEGEYRACFPEDVATISEAFTSMEAGKDTSSWREDREMLSGADVSAVSAIHYATGEQIGRYTVRKELGQGGFGTVYLAWDEELQRLVAVKVPRRERFKTREAEKRFTEEARTAAKLKHEAIVPVYDVGRQRDGAPFVVLEYVEGHHLENMLTSGRLSRTQVVELIAQITEAVHYAHKQGFIHRDLKPENIILDLNGEPHITDFGLAERWERIDPRSPRRATLIAGTSQFIPPEVYALGGSSSPQIDIYALGIILYRALTDSYPFRAGRLEEVEEQVLRGKPPMPREINPNIPEPLQRICLMAIEHDAAKRYRSAQMMADDLRRYLDGLEVLARPARYDTELHGKLKNHCTEIRSLGEQNLLRVSEMDGLLRAYWFVMETDSPWRSLSERFPWETVTIRLGGWLVLLSCLLWPWVYWPQLEPSMRVLSVGLPTIALNLVGWIFYSTNNRWNARVFLGTGALLVPLWAAVVLHEYNWLAFDQGGDREILENFPREWVTATNLQITLAAAVFVAYCALLVRASRAHIFVAWLGLGIYLLFGGILLRCGLKEWVLNEEVASALTYLLTPCLLIGLGAVWWETHGGREEAGVLYTYFPIPLVLVLTFLAWFGAIEWLHAEPKSLQNETINRWSMANSIVYAVLAYLGLSSGTVHLRFWGGFFAMLIPVSLLVPCNLLFDRGMPLGTIGGKPMTIYELTCGLVATAFVILGTRMNRAGFTIPGIVGLTVFIFRVTDRHFEDLPGWPLTMAIGGGLAMFIGVTSSLLRSKWQERS